MQYWYIACSWVCCCDRRVLGLDRLLGGGIRGPKVRDQLVMLRYGLLCKQDWPSIWWLGMLLGRQADVMWSRYVVAGTSWHMDPQVFLQAHTAD